MGVRVRGWEGVVEWKEVNKVMACREGDISHLQSPCLIP